MARRLTGSLPRELVVAAAQLGPVARGASRDEVVGRLLSLLRGAAHRAPSWSCSPSWP